ncbi:MAG: FAD-dependent monooxygenase [Candidatus Dormibacteraceae bacterium]
MRALICGAGIAGLTLARLHTDQGWEVLLVERARTARGGDYAIDLWGPGFDVAEALGLLPTLRRAALGIEEATFVDRRGRPVAALNYRQLGVLAGGRLLTILRRDLEHALREGLENRVDLREGTTVDRFKRVGGGVSVTLSDGTEQVADLLVGADGIHSRVRALAFGAEETLFRPLGIHVAAYTFVEPELSAFVGRRFWVADEVGRFFALYGLTGGRVGVLAAHRSDSAEVPEDPRPVLRRVHQGPGGPVAEALDQCPAPPSLFYDRVGQIEMNAWTCGPVVLVGDAAQAVSLLAGEGASLALAGAWALAAAVREEPGLDAALAAYERRMRPIVLSKQASGRRMATWFVPATRWRRLVRRFGLRLLRLRTVGPRLLRSTFGRGLEGPSWTDRPRRAT